MKAQLNECLRSLETKTRLVRVYLWLLLKSILSLTKEKKEEKKDMLRLTRTQTHTDATKRILIRWTLCVTSVIGRFLTVWRKPAGFMVNLQVGRQNKSCFIHLLNVSIQSSILQFFSFSDVHCVVHYKIRIHKKEG